MSQDLRAFFAERDVLEVETPVLSGAAISDPHLHSLATRYNGHPMYLHTSPEFFMKRMLSAYRRDIYQVCKVFRDDELGRWHNPEFSMLEWYRLGFDHFKLMDEVQQLFERLMHAFSANRASAPSIRITYRQAFLDSLQMDPLVASCDDLRCVAQKYNIDIPVGMVEQDRDMWLDWLLTQAVIPRFEPHVFTFLYDYPASQAALARLSEQDPRVAHRFEVFYGALELANGFSELTDADQQRRRFEQDNASRRQQGLPVMPLDDHLLAALEAGLPDCAGVALGLDRLLMVLTDSRAIGEVLSFDFDRI